MHTLSKVKSNVKGLTIGLNEDTLGKKLGCSYKKLNVDFNFLVQISQLSYRRNFESKLGPVCLPGNYKGKW